MARADCLPLRDAEPLETLIRAAGIDCPVEAGLPTAPIALLGEGVAVDPGVIWMHADPIHLRPDRARLLVYAGAAMAPDPDEAKALVAGFNRHFAGEDLWLIAPTPTRWYLRLARPIGGWRPAPLHRIQGGCMAEYLPRGPEAREWMRLLNEIQMLFYADPVNRRRETAGRPIISGIWPWGAGSLPLPSAPSATPDALIGDHPVLSGLAQLTRCPQRSLASWLDDPRPVGHQLIFWDRLWRAWLEHDLQAWLDALSELDAVIERLWRPLRSGALEAIRLNPCQDTVFELGTRQSWRFWRRAPGTGFGKAQSSP
ncbi:MAG: phosphoglycerate mutase [Thermochromatium sp.]